MLMCYTEYMKVDFYFDPACPWCWVTSRWLADVASQRDISPTWRPFSLALKNAVHDKDPSALSGHEKQSLASHRVLRVIEAAVEAGGDRGKLYSDIGTMHHVEGYDYTDTEIDLMLSLSRLDPALSRAADDASYDQKLRQSLDDAVSIVGEDVGVPLIVFETADKQKIGYFGPVLMRQPTGQDALDLWDGLSKLASAKDFYELKRSRPPGGPDLDGPAPRAVC